MWCVLWAVLAFALVGPKLNAGSLSPSHDHRLESSQVLVAALPAPNASLVPKERLLRLGAAVAPSHSTASEIAPSFDAPAALPTVDVSRMRPRHHVPRMGDADPAG